MRTHSVSMRMQLTFGYCLTLAFYRLKRNIRASTRIQFILRTLFMLFECFVFIRVNIGRITNGNIFGNPTAATRVRFSCCRENRETNKHFVFTLQIKNQNKRQISVRNIYTYNDCILCKCLLYHHWFRSIE